MQKIILISFFCIVSLLACKREKNHSLESVYLGGKSDDITNLAIYIYYDTLSIYAHPDKRTKKEVIVVSDKTKIKNILNSFDYLEKSSPRAQSPSSTLFQFARVRIDVRYKNDSTNSFGFEIYNTPKPVMGLNRNMKLNSLSRIFYYLDDLESFIKCSGKELKLQIDPP